MKTIILSITVALIIHGCGSGSTILVDGLVKGASHLSTSIEEEDWYTSETWAYCDKPELEYSEEKDSPYVQCLINHKKLLRSQVSESSSKKQVNTILAQ